MNMNRIMYGPGGWCYCDKCDRYVRHLFVTPCECVKCSKCGKLLRKR